MPDETLVMLVRRLITLDSQLDELDPATPEAERIVHEMESIGKLIQTDYIQGQQALDLEEKRRIDEAFKIEQLKNERKRCRTELGKTLLQSLIAAGASIGGATLLLKVKNAIEADGKYYGTDVWKWAYNFIVKIKS